MSATAGAALENVAGAVGLGATSRGGGRSGPETESARLAALRGRLELGILARVLDAGVNGKRHAARIPNTTNIYFDYLEGDVPGDCP